MSPSRPEVHVEDVHRAGGIPAILKEVNRRKNTGLKLDVPTVAGTLSDAVESAPDADGDVIRTVEKPFSETGGLAVLFGNLAPKGAVVKVAGVDPSMMEYQGKARIYESQEDALSGILAGQVKDGEVVVIRYEGRRHARPVHRPRRAGSRGRRPHRRHSGRRYHLHQRQDLPAGTED